MRASGGDFSVQLVNPVLQEASQYVLSLYRKRESQKLLVHHYEFDLRLVEEVTQLMDWEAEHGRRIMEMLPVQLAALFYATGKVTDYYQFAPHSQAIAQKWLQGRVSLELQQDVLHIMDVVSAGRPLSRPAEQILSDALFIVTFLQTPEETAPLLRLEQELFGSSYSRKEWNEWFLNHLLNTPLFSQAAQVKYAVARAETVHSQMRKQEKNKDQLAVAHLPDRPFDGLEGKPPLRAAQTYFRVNYRNHINLSSIADNKANIMISVNSILISILFTTLTYGNITQVRPVVLFPAVIFILTGVISLVFAVFSARPKVTKVLEGGGTFEQRQRNIMFFGSFVQMELKEYEEALDSVLHDGQLLYGNMARDIYFLGKVLDKKYRYLTISYNIFVAGLVISIASFFMVLFF